MLSQAAQMFLTKEFVAILFIFIDIFNDVGQCLRPWQDICEAFT